MIAYSYRWYAQKRLQTQAIELLLVNEHNGIKAYGQPINITLNEEGPSGIFDGEPTLKLFEGAAQSLLQALWDVGLRPNSGEGVSAHVDALKHNIEFAERVAMRLLIDATEIPHRTDSGEALNKLIDANESLRSQIDRANNS